MMPFLFRPSSKILRFELVSKASSYPSFFFKNSFFVVVWLLLSTPLAHAYNVNFSENMESSDPFRPWKSNEKYTINFKGLEQDAPLLGNKHFKLDITLDTASYAYFYIPLTPIPSAKGSLNFSGKIYLKEVLGHPVASLGTNISLTPAPTSGVNVIGRITQPSTKWITQTSDLITASAKTSYLLADYEATAQDTGFWTDSVGLYIFGSSGDRVVVHIDDLSIKGAVDDPVLYKKSSSVAWSTHLLGMQFVISNYQSKIDSLNNYLAQANSEKTQLLAGAKSAFSAVMNGFKNTLKASAQSVQKANDYWIVLNGLRQDDATIEELTIFPWPATKKLPAEQRSPDNNVNMLSVRMARDTTEAASFIMRATHHSVNNVSIAPSDLVATDGTVISADNIDVRIVKQWYQSNDGQILATPNKYLLSELLLKDTNLVRVDPVAQSNALRVKLPDAAETYIDLTTPTSISPGEATVHDSKTLLPFNLIAHNNQQIWLTFHVPNSAKPGFYKGSINIKGASGHTNTVNVELTVLPFTLSQSRLEYSIYYSSVLSQDDKPGFANAKSSDQIKIELANMRDHGIKYPTVYEPLANLEKRLIMMKAVGLPTDRLYALGNSWIQLPLTPEAIELFKKTNTSVLDVAARNSFTNIFFYGVDEAPLAVLAQERPFFNLTHQLGAKIFAAVAGQNASVDSIAASGDLIDTPVLEGTKTTPEDIAAWRKHGASRVFSYANPQVGIENPDIYRKNYGLGLFTSGYDGAMDFAYQFPFKAAWNDFDDGKYRDHMFTYPTSDGVIDTVQWEGFREGVDDTRYLATLLDIDPNRTEAEMRIWVSSLLNANKEISVIRELLIDEILKVHANKTTAKPIDNSSNNGVQ